MKILSNQEIRKFITTHFDDSELKTFCCKRSGGIYHLNLDSW